MHTRLQFQTKKGERDEHRWHSFITFLHLWKQENCHAHDDLAMDTISLKTANKSEKTYIHTRVINLILMSTGNPHWSKCPVLPKILVTTPGRLQNHTNQDASTVLVWVIYKCLNSIFSLVLWLVFFLPVVSSVEETDAHFGFNIHLFHGLHKS